MSQLPQIGAWGSELGNAFANIGQGVGKIMNPNKEIEDELRKRIAANPKIAQEMFDLEREQPGSMASIYGKNVAKWVRDRMQSSGSLVETATRDAFGSGRTSADIAKSETALDQGVHRAITGQTQDQSRVTAAGATTGEAQASVAPIAARNQQAELDAELPLIAANTRNKAAVLEGQAKAAELSNANVDEVLKNWTKAKGVDFQALARKVGRNQTLTPEEQSTLQIIDNPQSPHKETWQRLVQGVQNSDQLGEQAKYHNFVMAKENQDLMGRVITEWSRLGKPGGSAVYLKEYMFDPKAAAQAEQDAVLPAAQYGQLPADRKALAQVARAMASDNKAGDMKLGIQLDVQERLSNEDYKKAILAKDPNDQTIQSAAQQLSSIYTDKAKLAGNDVQVIATPSMSSSGMGDQKVSFGDLSYQVIRNTPSGPQPITVDETDLRKLFVKPTTDRSPGTGEPQEPAYKGSGKTTIESKSGSYKIGADPTLDPWAKIKTVAERTAALKIQYPDKTAYQTARQRLIDAGIEVY